MTEHDDSLPVAFARQVETAADQSAADAAALSVGPHRHRSQGECPDGLSPSVMASWLNRMWPTIVALLDSDEFDQRKLCRAQVFDQP